MIQCDTKGVHQQLTTSSTLTPIGTKLNSQSSVDWSNLNSVFPTPQSMQSIPATPTLRPDTKPILSPTTPPPLPPMPSQYMSPTAYQSSLIQQQQQQQQQAALFYQQQVPLNQQFNLMSMTPNQFNLATSSTSSMYTTPTPSYTAMHANNTMLSSPIGAVHSSANANETFEQKWARIQAAKKTNPFAEDIAKKFEIKLT